MGNDRKEKIPFEPKPGQIDFSHVRWAPVVNCVVQHQGKILLVKRSEHLNLYPGYWNGISGFLDDYKSLQEKVYEELQEELGMTEDKIKAIKLGEIFDQEEPKYGKTWIVHPVLVEVVTDKIKLDWEAEKYQWLALEKVSSLNLLPGFDQVLNRLSHWLTNN